MRDRLAPLCATAVPTQQRQCESIGAHAALVVCPHFDMMVQVSARPRPRSATQSPPRVAAISRLSGRAIENDERLSGRAIDNGERLSGRAIDNGEREAPGGRPRSIASRHRGEREMTNGPADTARPTSWRLPAETAAFWPTRARDAHPCGGCGLGPAGSSRGPLTCSS